jgi:hypothetical protein
MVSIGLTFTSLFISGQNGLQPMDIRVCDEEKTWRPLCFVLLRLRKDTWRLDTSVLTHTARMAMVNNETTFQQQ